MTNTIVVQAARLHLPNHELARMRIALVHDWLTGMRGGEKCLELLCREYPDAHLYALIHRRGSLAPAIERMDIRTSFLQRVPGILEHYRYFLPLMPIAIESLRLTGYDLVVSLSHCVAKSVRVPAGVPHLCYCFTPMRYAWHMRQAYGVRGLAAGGPRAWLLADLRRWDRSTSGRVSQFVAISRTVAQRIQECYGRDSTVIYPPVAVDYYTPADVPREPFYLCVSALVPYKRLDLAIEACHRLGRELVVIGSGPEFSRLRRLAGPQVRLLGWQSDEVIREHYRRCRALLFPGEEDFGIVPLEAQACGAPVIGYGRGGLVETVVAPRRGRPGSGLFFDSQSADGLMAAMSRLESAPDLCDARAARAQAERFSASLFVDRMRGLIEHVSRGARVVDEAAA